MFTHFSQYIVSIFSLNLVHKMCRALSVFILDCKCENCLHGSRFCPRMSDKRLVIYDLHSELLIWQLEVRLGSTSPDEGFFFFFLQQYSYFPSAPFQFICTFFYLLLGFLEEARPKSIKISHSFELVINLL